jgi:MFS superfamily sulfate permease-like transporter
VLSAIVIQAVWGLMDVAALRRYAQVRRNDFASAVLALVGVVLFGPLYGLLLAVAQSVLGLVYRSSRVHLEVMGKVSGEKAAWGGLTRHPERESIEGILVLRLDNPLFWVNSAVVHDEVLAAVARYPDTQVVILDLEATPQLDTTSVDALEGMLATLREDGIDLFLVRVLRRSRTVLDRSGFLERLGPDHVWHSISQGVREAKGAIKASRKAAKRSAVDELDDTSDGGAVDAQGDHEERVVMEESDDSEDEPPVHRLRWLHRGR